MKTIRCLLLLAALLICGARLAPAASLFEVESAYLGDGWFQYRVKTVGDPLFPVVDVTSFGVPFASRVQYGANPALWISDSTNPNRADWIYDSLNPQPAGYQATFTARSSELGFKTVTTNAVAYSFVFNSGEPGAKNETGFGLAEFAILVPCPPAQSDNSPTNRVSGFEPLPALKIDKLLKSGASFNGVSFSWIGDFTVMLQASSNLNQWRDVARIFGTGASNSWTTNQPLNSQGNFFRLKLVGQGHIP